jgi:hypothetical protein
VTARSATILQMSTEGALDIEPVDDRSVQIRLRDQAPLRKPGADDVGVFGGCG